MRHYRIPETMLTNEVVGAMAEAMADQDTVSTEEVETLGQFVLSVARRGLLQTGEEEDDGAFDHAQLLAATICARMFPATRFESQADMRGVLDQIDHMTSAMANQLEAARAETQKLLAHDQREVLPGLLQTLIMDLAHMQGRVPPLNLPREPESLIKVLGTEIQRAFSGKSAERPQMDPNYSRGGGGTST